MCKWIKNNICSDGSFRSVYCRASIVVRLLSAIWLGCMCVCANTHARVLMVCYARKQ